MKNQIINKKVLEILKKDKKMLVVVLIGFLGVFSIALSEMNLENEADKNSKPKSTGSYDYCSYLEERVADIISAIDGAGKVRVMITLAETTEYVYAQNQNDTKKVNSDSENSDNKNDFVIIEKDNNDSGLLIKTFEPKIRGVAVVCDGGDNPTVQQQIYSAVSAVLNVSTARISISKLTSEKE